MNKRGLTIAGIVAGASVVVALGVMATLALVLPRGAALWPGKLTDVAYSTQYYGGEQSSQSKVGQEGVTKVSKILDDAQWTPGKRLDQDCGNGLNLKLRLTFSDGTKTDLTVPADCYRLNGIGQRLVEATGANEKLWSTSGTEYRVTGVQYQQNQAVQGFDSSKKSQTDPAQLEKLSEILNNNGWYPGWQQSDTAMCTGSRTTTLWVELDHSTTEVIIADPCSSDDQLSTSISNLVDGWNGH